MGSNIFNEFWDKIGYKRVVLAFMFIFGVISPGIGIVFVRKPHLFESIGITKIIALSFAVGMPFVVANIVVGTFIAYLFFFRTNERENIHEDKIARLTLTSSILVASLSLNAFLVLTYGYSNKKLVDIGKIIFAANLILDIFLQVLLLCKVSIMRIRDQ